MKNIEGRIDTYEEYGKNTTVALTVSRNIGTFGGITITWQAEPREATALDFTPVVGTLTMGSGGSSADIIITILDDGIPEEMEVTVSDFIGILFQIRSIFHNSKQEGEVISVVIISLFVFLFTN